VILVDANLLIYAVNADSAHHAAARRWFEGVLSSPQPVGLPLIAVLAFLRITTRAAIFPRPLTPDVALAYVDSWLDLPYVELVGPGPNHWAILRALLIASGTAGNLTSDAHLAALAIERRCRLFSADADFGRFPGLEYHNPLR
jgi:toxin-antitoxin system PIN domain toxin